MKCSRVQSRLLAAERPDEAAAEVAHHLSRCAACRAVASRLARIERALPLLPVPPSSRRSAFIAKFVQQTPAELAAAESPTLPLVKLVRRPVPAKERGQRKLAIAVALAASLAFLVSALLALNSGKDKPPADYAAVDRIHYETRLQTARTPRERADTALDVAEELRDKVRTLATAPVPDDKQLRDLANFYSELVKVELQSHVRKLPSDASRKLVLQGLETRLRQTESEFAHLAAAKGANKTGESLNLIAMAARTSCDELHSLQIE
jgi:hypothetical protein